MGFSSPGAHWPNGRKHYLPLLKCLIPSLYPLSCLHPFGKGRGFSSFVWFPRNISTSHIPFMSPFSPYKLLIQSGWLVKDGLKHKCHVHTHSNQNSFPGHWDLTAESELPRQALCSLVMKLLTGTPPSFPEGCCPSIPLLITQSSIKYVWIWNPIEYCPSILFRLRVN